MKNTSTFQLVFLAVFVLVAIVGVAVFAGFGGSSKAAVPKATIWGTIPAFFITDTVRILNASSNALEVTYVQKDPQTFQNEFVNALAEGNGPDAVLLSDDMLYTFRNKLQPIPYTAFALRDFQSTFIDGASVFASKDGLLAIPISVDPLVMYYNKNILARAAVSRAPQTWDEMSQIGPVIIQRTDTSTIQQALLSFGDYANVNNAKAILSTLLFQAGNNITAINALTGSAYTVLDKDTSNNNIANSTDSNTSGSDSSSQNDGTTATESVLDFYTSFANPAKSLYTWNRSLPNSLDYFLSGNLAFYFGFASEISQIQAKNPNLNFDVAQVPQNMSGIPNVYGKIYALAIVKQTKNAAGALGVISQLTNQTAVQHYIDIANLPPARRDLLAQQPKDPFMTVFYRSAIQVKSWFDPSPAESDRVFQDMVESIISGKSKLSNAVSDAKQKLDILLKSN